MFRDHLHERYKVHSYKVYCLLTCSFFYSLESTGIFLFLEFSARRHSRYAAPELPFLSKMQPFFCSIQAHFEKLEVSFLYTGEELNATKTFRKPNSEIENGP